MEETTKNEIMNNNSTCISDYIYTGYDSTFTEYYKDGHISTEKNKFG
jgi:hypothetical protein